MFFSVRNMSGETGLYRDDMGGTLTNKKRNGVMKP